MIGAGQRHIVEGGWTMIFLEPLKGGTEREFCVHILYFHHLYIYYGVLVVAHSNSVIISLKHLHVYKNTRKYKSRQMDVQAGGFVEQ